jgi:hypothetical protein
LPIAAEAPQFRPGLGHQFVALLHRVAKGGRDENETKTRMRRLSLMGASFGPAIS